MYHNRHIRIPTDGRLLAAILWALSVWFLLMDGYDHDAPSDIGRWALFFALAANSVLMWTCIARSRQIVLDVMLFQQRHEQGTSVTLVRDAD